MSKYGSEREEKLLERIIETDGIKKIQDAITAVVSGPITVKGSEGQIFKQTPDGKLVVELG